MTFPRYRLSVPHGISDGCELLDLETNHKIANISKVELSIEPDNIVTAIVTVVGVAVDATVWAPGVVVVDEAKVADLFRENKRLFADNDYLREELKRVRELANAV